MMPSIFLSHSSEDKFFVRELAEKLRDHGVDVWLDEFEIQVGESLTQKIGEAIEENDYLGVVLSRNSIQSEWVQKELQVALQRELREKRVVVLPLLLETVDLPPFLQDKLYADFTDPSNFEQSLPRVLSAMGIEIPPKDVHKNSVGSSPLPSLTNAQRKLAAFEDLSLIDLDLEMTNNPDEQYALLNMYLKLNQSPPPEWRKIFEAERRFPRHTMWRKAWIEGEYIVVYCVPDELEKYHLPDLKVDVESANRKYREYLVEVAQEEAREAIKLQQDEEQLNALRKRLDFD